MTNALCDLVIIALALERVRLKLREEVRCLGEGEETDIARQRIATELDAIAWAEEHARFELLMLGAAPEKASLPAAPEQTRVSNHPKRNP